MRRSWRMLAAALAVVTTAVGTPCSRAAEPDALAGARALLLSGKYAEAIEAYEKLEADDAVAAVLGLAACEASTGLVDEARKRLEAAAGESPDSAALHAELARLAFERGDYDAARRSSLAAERLDPANLKSRWVTAELLRTAGHLDQANAAYEWFVDYYNEHDVSDAESMHWIGLAAAQFARWNSLSDQFTFLVNDLYPDALEIDPAYWPALYETGRLFLEKYNQAEASRALRKALELNPSAAEVYAALAQLALQNYELDAARQAFERALEINPKLLDAHLAHADLLLADFRAAEAIEVLEKARELNPVSEPLLGRLAAATFVVDGEAAAGEVSSRTSKLIAEATKRNAAAGEFFFALGSALDSTRRFPAAARYYDEAVQRMPQLVAPRGALGLMYMRLGDEVAAKKLLDEAFEVDPFNVRVSNSLKVLEVLDTYAVLETDHFVIKFDRGADEILAKYVARYLEDEVYPELTESFGFEPQGKSLFEIFSRARNTNGHGWFSARMVGLPYVGTVGACAGKMVAMASPNDMEQKYNWARVVKHEFVHVLNLQQTHFNIPHWFTEALAVQSEGYPRPEIWDDLLATRVPQGELMTLDTINLGFIRPKSSLDWQMAYCQAQLYAQYMLATYGDDALAKMLAAYADNLDTRAALRRSFDVAQDDFERGYRQFVDEIVAGLSKRRARAEESFAALVRAQQQLPDDVDLAARLAEAQFNRKSYAEARRLADDVLATDARHQLAAYVRARVHLVVGETDEATTLLTDALDDASPEPRLVNLLAALHLKAERYDEAVRLYQLAAKADPANRDWTKALVRAYLLSGDEAPLEALLVQMAAWDADDAAVRKKLARLAKAAGDDEGVIRWATEILHVDVMDVEAHRLLAEAYAGSHDDRRAADEYDVAVRLEPDDVELRVELVEALARLGENERARRALDALQQIAPDDRRTQSLLESLKVEGPKP